MRIARAAGGGVATAIFLAAPGAVAAAATAGEAGTYQAEIRRTSGGVPHVKARDFGSLGFGYGYAYAQDQLCDLAEIVVTVNGRRSRFFGPEGRYNTAGGQTGIGNLASDFFFQKVKDEQTVERLLRRPYPNGPSREVRDTIRGFAAGFNAYLRRTGRANLPDPRCRGKGWVRPITVMDLYRRFFQLAVRASSGNFINELAAAKPPGATAARAAGTGARLPAADVMRRALAADPVLGDGARLGSNAYGIGRDGSRNGRGLVLGNPHFPWQGAERFYEVHLTIPGRLDVTGASLQAVPAVNIGFTKGVAWSHTVSTARRFTPYELDLIPGKPTSYRLDGRERAMTTRTVKVPVSASRTATHTYYETPWGTVLDYPTATLVWTADNAYALADVNAGNFRLLNQWAEYDQAQSVGDLRRAYARVQGTPWVNTIAADAEGDAYYADESVVPHVDAALQARCASFPKARLLLSAGGVIMLDGSRSDCAWGNDPDAKAKGIFGPRNLPRLVRRDYVSNSNDSYWLANPRRPLTGFARIIGPERTQRSLRTRLGFLQAEQRLAGTDALGPPGFTRANLKGVFQRNRVLSSEMARTAVVEACRAAPSTRAADGRTVDLSAACAVLAAWGQRGDLGSQGEILWRELWSRLTEAGVPWGVPFSASDPLRTPNSLRATDPVVLRSLAGAVLFLRDNGLALNVQTGVAQSEPRGRERIPIHGCPGTGGCFNVISPGFDPVAKRYDPYTGSSFVMAAGFGRSGPRGDAILTYSQSENPRSPHYADQTKLYSRKRWLPMRFTDAEIRADPEYSRTVVSAAR